MTIIDPLFNKNKKLKDLIIEMHGEEKLLLDKFYRDILIDLLKTNEANLLCQILGLQRKDLNSSLFEKLKKKTYRRGSSEEESLFNFFNMYPPILPVKRDLTTNTIADSSYQLFKHQRNAVKEVRKKLNIEPNKVLLHMPTGSGKTRTAMNIISDHFRENEPTSVIWLASSEELCEQAAEEFEKAWSFLGDRSIQVHRFWGNREIDINNINDGFVVAGFTKLVKLYKSRHGHQMIANFSRKISLIVVDEAHQAIANTYKDILDALYYGNVEKKLLGLSATPGRTWNDVNSDEKLAEFFSKRKVKLDVEGYDNPIDYLVSEGYLAKINYKNLMHKNINTRELIDLSDINDVPKEILKKLGEDDQRNIKIISEAERLSRFHKRIILFAPSVSCSEMLSFILRAKGINSYSLTGNTISSERKRIIDDFKNDDLTSKIICNYGVLTTGFDAPKISAAIIARPTISLVLYSQMIGRAIRGYKAGGNAEAEIVTIIDQGLPGFRSVAESFENWEDVWE